MMQPRCSGATKAGAPCQAPAMSGGRYCLSHDPSRVTDLAEWRAKGGRGKSNRQRAKKGMADQALTPGEIEGFVAVAMKAVLSGRLEPGVGNAVANLARAAVAVREATTIEVRLTELEKAAGVAGKGWSA